MTVLLALAGTLLLGVSVAGFVYFLPRKGLVHPWVELPVLESAIPLIIMAAAIFGVATLAAAFA